MSDIRYEEYLERFAAALGDVEVGAFAKHKGQLVQKLNLEEFLAQESIFDELYRTYTRSLRRGDTINDMVVRMLRENAAKLIRKDPVEL